MVNQNHVKRIRDAFNDRLKGSGREAQKNIDRPKLLSITVRKHVSQNDVADEKNKDDLQNIKRGNRH
jgi:hypothetical protein